MKTCRECVDFLMAYLEGTLPPDEKATFETHLAKCPPCVEFMKSYKLTVELGKVAGEPCKHTCMPDAMVKAILQSRHTDTPHNADAPKA